MTLRKWNYKLGEYEPLEVPDDWNCKIYTDNMNEIVNCPHCGKQLPYGKTYTSLEIHKGAGIGYGVCVDCYNEEWKRRKKYNG